MNDLKSKFQQLLRELFQFDLSDLDFGVYRIRNQKLQVIKHFINEYLPKAIQEEMQQGALAEQTQAQQALEEARPKVLENFGDKAIDAEGNLAPQYVDTPLGKAYLEAREKAAHAQSSEALEFAVYNHLYTFFSRYYQDGDFISKRRFSKKERYAIPYNGEEVYLYWANHDQYYVKTTEHFTDYTWRAHSGVTVHFKLQAADVEQNNVKGEKRFFLPVLDGIAWNATTCTLVVPFEYRPLTNQEAITHGNRNQQEKIIEEALQDILERLKGNAEALAALIVERRKDTKGNSVTYLAHHLRQYTARSTYDFFIHKDLKGFLYRELDFYLKNEVLNLEELADAGENLAEGWFQLLRLIKRIGNRIIDFLAQIEDFQKMLWEKKKFITEAFYCITVGIIPEEFYPEIADIEVQWQEWRLLFAVEVPEERDGRIAFLKAHPTLVLDTRHFEQDFTDRLLASFDPSTGSGKGLDELTDGLLVHSENWQTLNLLLEKYREGVKCIYIDPPYNSKTTEILYKNTYKSSSWLCLMDNRLALSRYFSTVDGSHIVAIDENEQEVLGRLLTIHFPSYVKVCVSVIHNKKGIQGDYFSYNNDFAYFLIPPALPETHGKPISEAEWDYANLRKWGRESERETAKNCFYPIFVEGENIIGFGEVCDEDFHPGIANSPVDKAGKKVAVYPVDSNGIERKWRYARGSVEHIRHLLKVHITELGEIQIHKAKAEKSFKTVWDDPSYIAGDYGTKWLTDLGLKISEDLYPKSIHAVEDSIFAVSDGDSLILDYFAGSGTTGHAVIKLNRQDASAGSAQAAGQRKFILVEMGEYFDTVLLPRIKKVTFSPEWKNGKPKRMATPYEAERSPRIVKIIRLESSEDALNNIVFDEQGGQRALEMFGDEYLLRYMLKWESRRSETLLNVEKLQSPFSYKLHIHRNGEIREQMVDLHETFNYLIGLEVETRRVYRDAERRYLVYSGITRVGRKVAIIWRETTGWTVEDYERDAQFVATQNLVVGAEEVFVNGDSLIPSAQSLDGLFKARMFVGTEA